ncbi:MAG: hypothetical protein HONBIEJF_01514 [Fimbriimonadaceae bacterium]|nr:hypothetical protein [Fimbriimonadaceae bacterium]
MHRHTAKISWSRNGKDFAGGRYSRGHEWEFDGGIRVPASSAPQIVPPPLGIVEAVDPEEALVAAASSCHMLSFLYLAHKEGFVVERYVDEAVGEMGENENGKSYVARIALRPAIEFSGARRPSAEELAALHHRAHEECYIANSIRSDVRVESA